MTLYFNLKSPSWTKSDWVTPVKEVQVLNQKGRWSSCRQRLWRSRRLRFQLLRRRPLWQILRQKGSHCLRIKGDLKWNIFAITVAFVVIQYQISSSFTLSKDPIFKALKEMRKGSQEESKPRETMVNTS